MSKEFKEFAMRGNVLDMAVGIISGAVHDESMKHSVKVTVIATGIKADKIGLRPRTATAPAVRTAQQSVKNLMAKEEKLPVEVAAAPPVPE